MGFGTLGSGLGFPLHHYRRVGGTFFGCHAALGTALCHLSLCDSWLIPQESAEPRRPASKQSLVDRPRRKAGPPAYAKPSARMCPIEESRLSTPFQPACGRACREVGWSGRWETKTQAGPQRTGQAKMHQATVYPPSRVKKTGSLFGPRTFFTLGPSARYLFAIPGSSATPNSSNSACPSSGRPPPWRYVTSHVSFILSHNK